MYINASKCFGRGKEMASEHTTKKTTISIKKDNPKQTSSTPMVKCCFSKENYH